MKGIEKLIDGMTPDEMEVAGKVSMVAVMPYVKGLPVDALVPLFIGNESERQHVLITDSFRSMNGASDSEVADSVGIVEAQLKAIEGVFGLKSLNTKRVSGFLESEEYSDSYSHVTNTLTARHIIEIVPGSLKEKDNALAYATNVLACMHYMAGQYGVNLRVGGLTDAACNHMTELLMPETSHVNGIGAFALGTGESRVVSHTNPVHLGGQYGQRLLLEDNLNTVVGKINGATNEAAGYLMKIGKAAASARGETYLRKGTKKNQAIGAIINHVIEPYRNRIHRPA